MKLQPVIGLEIHFQMKTKTKMFCRCQNVNDGGAESFTRPVCMGHRDTSVLNAQALEWLDGAGDALRHPLLSNLIERAIFIQTFKGLSDFTV